MRRSSLVRSGAAMTSLRWLFEDAVSLHVFRCSLVTLAVITVSTTASTSLNIGTRNCGSDLTDEGSFTSPNYPDRYPNNAYCIWNISASPGQVLQLFCLSFDLEMNYDYINITSQLCNKAEVNSYILSGNSSVCSWILGTTARVMFHSDSVVRRQGFVIGYRSVAPATICNRTPFTQCGGNITDSGTISSPNYPEAYPSNSRCIWRLRALDGQVLRLFFKTYDVEKVYDTVLIYNSSDISQGAAMDYTSYWQQNVYNEQFNSEVIVMFTSDDTVEGKGFQIDFTSDYMRSYVDEATIAPYEECGGNFTDSGNISSPNYPGNYPSNSICNWTLEATDGQVLRLFFKKYDVDDSDSLLIYNSANISEYYEMTYTSDWQQDMNYTFDYNVSVVFTSDESVERQGFLIEFTSEYPSSECGGYFTHSGNISSPNYPEKYPSDSSCNWTLQAPDGQVLRLFFKQYDVDDSDTLLIYNSTSISEDSEMSYTANWKPNKYYTFGSKVNVTFTSDESVEKQGFLLEFTSEYPFAINDEPSTAPYVECGGNFEGSGYISSPNYPEDYPSNSICIWRLTAFAGQVLRLFFNTYDVENAYDKVLIYNSMDLKQGSAIDYTYYWQEDMYFKQFNSELIVVFTSDDTVERQGFQIYFASEYPSDSSAPSGFVCSYNLTNEGNITSPNYPAMYPNNTICTWTLSASPGKVLQLYCRSFDVEDTYDYLHVTSQVPNEAPTNSYRLTGISSDCSWILGPTAIVTFTSDASGTRQGFALGYRSIEPPQ